METDSHKLKTPLTAIFGYAQLIQSNSQNLTKAQKRWINELVKETKRLILLLDGVAKTSH